MTDKKENSGANNAPTNQTAMYEAYQNRKRSGFPDPVISPEKSKAHQPNIPLPSRYRD